MDRKSLIQSVINQANPDKAFENEALATYVEDRIAQRIMSVLSENDVQEMEEMINQNVDNAKVYSYLEQKIPDFKSIIDEEVKNAKARFNLTG